VKPLAVYEGLHSYEDSAYLWAKRRADERTRTADLLITSELLYLLSYVGLLRTASISQGVRDVILLLDQVPHLHGLALDKFYLVAVRVLDEGYLVIVPVGGEGLGFERHRNVLLLEARHRVLQVVDCKCDVGVAVALVVRLGPVVVVGKLQHGRRSVRLHRIEVVGRRT
jgi:hypothetical protein